MKRPLTRLEAAFAALFIPVATLSWVGLLLVEAGAFTPGRALAGAVALAVAGWAWLARDLRAKPPRSTLSRSMKSAAWIAITLAAAAALYAKPGDYLIEGRDASVYLAVGHTIQRSGGLTEPDPVLPLLSGEARDGLLTRDRSWPRLPNRFPGGIQITEGDRVVPNFFHLLPVWIALFVGALRLARRVLRERGIRRARGACDVAHRPACLVSWRGHRGCRAAGG